MGNVNRKLNLLLYRPLRNSKIQPKDNLSHELHEEILANKDNWTEVHPCLETGGNLSRHHPKKVRRNHVRLLE